MVSKRLVVDPTPKKSLGQHWLTDTDILKSIVKSSSVSPDDVVLEIGPGLGTLTKILLSTKAHIIAVEFDTELACKLTKQVEQPHNLQVINQDIRKFRFDKLPQNYKLVANIPYYLTSHLIRIITETPNKPLSASILVQKEVAERITAKPGQMSILAISAQVFNEALLGEVVPASKFIPPPKVDSQLVILTRRENPLVPGNMQKVFFRLVKAGFGERRKKMRSSLSGGLHIEKTKADKLLNEAKINPNARAQELSIDDWVRLTKVFML